MDSKFYYPRLMARICAADMTVTDADIYAWDGNMAWLPSVPGSLQDCYDCKASEAASDNSVELLLKYEASRVVQTGSRKVDSLSMLSELYRVTASLLHKQTWHAHQFDSGSPGAFLDYNLYDQLLQRSGLAAQGINLIQKLLQGSSFKSALLWPIGIIMRDLIPEQLAERECLISGLDYLSKHFHMKHFDCLRTSLELSWTRPTHDRGKSDTLLLG